MGENSKIEWTHHTFNPWIGCSRVHTGCRNCYAEAQNARWQYTSGWGDRAPRKVTAEANWRKPLQWAKAAAKAGERHRVFCASLADVLDERAPKEAQDRLWRLIRETARIPAPGFGWIRNPDATLAGLDWLLLTKRPERWEVVPEDVRPHVWLGTSISDQETADTFVPRLLAAEGFGRKFLSIEPMVGPIDLFRAYEDWLGEVERGEADRIDWVIVGGESGPGARAFDVSWARSVVVQCAAAQVPCFVKQLGARPRISQKLEHVDRTFNIPGGRARVVLAKFESEAPLALKDKKGGDPTEWPEDLRVRQFPGVTP